MSFDTTRPNEEAERINEELRRDGWDLSLPERVYAILLFGRDTYAIGNERRDARVNTYAAAVMNKCRRPAMVPA